ncbi:hypothetical protein C8J56DRAFT_1039117 [Mycena floridula]|nr:hypothetical protein C8J56DRAFT_1039117 [Mycena floridula]
MKQPKASKPSTGPPQALIACIEHLDSLLKHLPQNLPLDPPTSGYNFNLDPEILEDGGPLAAASQCLKKATMMADGSHLVADTTEEDIWVYNDSGTKWRENGALPVENDTDDRE